MKQSASAFRRSGLLLMVALVSTTGCGKSASPDDLNRAREAVQSSLDAWKKGERPEALKQHVPPIQFADDDWKAGLSLVEYKVTNTDADSNLMPRCWVALSLQDKRGKRHEKQVVYNVDAKATITIARDPYY